MRRRAGLAAMAALLAAAVAVPAARADWRIDGHGFGHGAGLAQYGARGYAEREHRGHAWILRHYYPGTRLAAAPRATLRVRLKESTALRVSGASLVRATGGRRVRLVTRTTYRLAPVGDGDLLRLTRTGSDRALARLHAPVRVLGAGALRLLGRAENGVDGGRYRGTLLLRRTGVAHVLAVNHVDVEDYLLGVVPAEMPASWPAAALRAQAVAARSYALTSRRPADAFDVFTDTRSQMYRGVTGEAPQTTVAVRATRRVAVQAGTTIARALFSSSSGGRTAAVEEAFPGADPVSYLRSVDDPYDTISPYHDWTVTFAGDDAAKRLRPVLSGDLVALAVVAITPSGRAATVRVTGTAGVQDVPAAKVRTLLGLRSTWFEITYTNAPPESNANSTDRVVA